VLDDNETSSNHNKEFWNEFNGFKDPSSLPEGQDDASVDTGKETRQMYRISDASGSMEFVSVTPSNGKLSKDLLDTNDVFLIHASTGKTMLIFLAWLFHNAFFVTVPSFFALFLFSAGFAGL
jgi:hypothetical protein